MTALCNTCCRPAHSPFRVYDAHGKVTLGCIDACHDGQLYGESARWHNRPEARHMRKLARDSVRLGYTFVAEREARKVAL